jgi:hypothetical protein
MRLSSIAFAGLIAFSSNLGVQSQAIPNEVSISSPIDLRDTQTLENNNIKRRRFVSTPRPIAIRSPQPASPPAKKPKPPPTKKPASPPTKKSTPSKPPPAKGTPSKAVCLKRIKTKGAARRATYTKADATDFNKVYQWLLDNETRLKGEDIVKERLVFFVSGGGEGRTMAKTFIDANPSYARYDDIFQRSAYSGGFGQIDARKGSYAEAALKAFALWARNSIVFNSDKGMYSSVGNIQNADILL